MPLNIQPNKSSQQDKVYFSVEVLESYDNRNLGVPKPDEYGYYTLPIGALNARSRNQCYYDTKSIYDQITNESSPFNMMITQGQLYGEFGHPDRDAPIERIEEIREKNRSHHIRKVFCGEEQQDGSIPIYGVIKPCGNYGPQLLESINNKWENTAFSLRSLMKFTWDAVRKAQYRTIVRLVTFDYVGAPGFLQASKRYAPGIEGMIDGRELSIEEFFNANGERVTNDYGQVAFESFSNSDLIKLFNVKNFSIGNIKNGKYIPNSTTYLDLNNNKRSIIHDLLLQK